MVFFTPTQPLKFKCALCISKSQIRIFEKNCQNKIFTLLLRICFFVATTKSNKFSGTWHYDGLLHFVVATPKFFSTSCRCVRENFWRARTPKLQMLHQKMIKKNCVLRDFSSRILRCWSARDKIFPSPPTSRWKKFCCYNKMQQSLIILLTRKFVVATKKCCQKIFQQQSKIFGLTSFLKDWVWLLNMQKTHLNLGRGA